MEFGNSTQARSWLFNEGTLQVCRQQAVLVEDFPMVARQRVRKFASGFHRRALLCHDNKTVKSPFQKCILSVSEQEMLLSFHAHQIRFLVGSSALLHELRNSDKVRSTAITLFRRFFLSNSCLEINPRQIAVASAFLASKIEEEKIEIEILAYATSVMEAKVRRAPLCRRELCALSIPDIEQGERLLMEGLNYELICHHPSSAMQSLASELSAYLSQDCCDRREPVDYTDEYCDEILERAAEIENRSLIFSDVMFLFTPTQIAFAIMAIVLGSYDEDGCMGEIMENFIVSRTTTTLKQRTTEFAEDVNRAIRKLVSCPLMGVRSKTHFERRLLSERSEMLRCVLEKVASFRLFRQICTYPPPQSRMGLDCKRSRYESDFTPPRYKHKFARVTPGHY